MTIRLDEINALTLKQVLPTVLDGFLHEHAFMDYLREGLPPREPELYQPCLPGIPHAEPPDTYDDPWGDD